MGWLELTRQHRGSYGNPGSRNEAYDPREEQIRAMAQGVYESLVKAELGHKGDFCDENDVRLDVKSGMYRNPDKIRELVGKAFGISRGNAKKQGYMEHDPASDRYVMTPRAVAASHDRYRKDVDHLMINRQDYEETLSLSRKEDTAKKQGFYRVTEELTAQGPKYFVWPLRPGQDVPKAYESAAQAEQVRDLQNLKDDPRRTNRWWSPPDEPYTERQLRHWLPPESIFLQERRRVG
jgi:hypothetical protein